MRAIKQGSTSQSTVIRIMDATTGAPKTDVTHASAGLSLFYRVEGGSVVSITPASLATVNAAYTSGGIIHIQNGYYRLDVPNGAFTSGAGVQVGGAVTGGVIYGMYHPLVAYDPLDATSLGLSRIDAAISSRQATVSFPTNFASMSISAGGVVQSSLRDVLGTAVTESVAGRLAGSLSVFLDVATPVFSVASANQTGDAYARLGAPVSASISGDIAAVSVQLSGVDASVADVQDVADTIAGALPANFAALSITVDGKLAALGSNAITSGVLATDAIGASELSDAAIAKIRNGVLDRVLAGNHDASGTVGKVLQDTLQAAMDCDGGSGGGLAGPYTLEITVRDLGTLDPIEGAKIRLFRAGEFGVVHTDVTGTAVYAVEAATWHYAITASGYSGSSGDIVVDDNASLDVSLAPVVVPYGVPPLCAVIVEVYNQYGQPLPGASIECMFVRYTDAAEDTYPVLSIPEPVQTDEDGRAHVELLRDAQYTLVCAAAGTKPKRIDVTVPDDDTYVVQIGA